MDDKEIKQKSINEITDKYSDELRLCIQFATPFSCEGIAVKILKEAIKECFMIKCSKKNKPKIKTEINVEFMVNYYKAKSKAKDINNVEFIANGKKYNVRQLG